jgi:6-phosphogluconolactonase (cycloisomerase 2 family)
VKKLLRSMVGVGVIGLTGWLGASAAGAQEPSHGARGADHAVFVQTDNTSGNQVIAYSRSDNGTLTLAHTYDTGGSGGVLNGSAVDHLASQGSLAYDPVNARLYAVNAGSNTVSVFSVRRDELSLRQVISSGGTFPVSIAVHGKLVYVLNALDGSVAGFRTEGGKLHAIHGSTRSLGLAIPGDTSQFTHTPGQVAFSPDGSQLVVTTKANGNDIDAFSVRPDGRLSRSPAVNPESADVPFAVTFDQAGHLVVANAGPNSLSTYTLNADGTVDPIDAVDTGQAATCWVASAHGFFYASNAGSGSVSRFAEGPRADGQLTLLGLPTSTDPGTVDAAATGSGQYLYVQTGRSGIVDEFAVQTDGSLNPVGSVTVPGAVGGEGIVAS